MQELTRREFVGRTAAVLVTLSFFSLGESACRNANRRIGDLEIRDGKIIVDLEKPSFHVLQTPGQGVSITFDTTRKPLLVSRIGEREVVALSSQCTHAGYTVLPPEHGVLICSSGHGGRYSLDGKVLHGPPTSSLASYPCRLDGTLIIIDYPA